MTGIRLAELSLPYSFMIHSNMTRAIETANLITESLPKVPVWPADSILREGAPIAPEPKLESWKPDYYYQVRSLKKKEVGFKNPNGRITSSAKMKCANKTKLLAP